VFGRRHRSSGGRRGEIPDPQDPATFERSRLDWSEREREPHAGLLAWHRSLIAYRRAHPELRDGTRPTVELDEAERWLTMERGGILVAANLGDEVRALRLPLGEGPAGARLDLASADGVRLADGRIKLPPWSAGVVLLRPPGG
jgi:maltooligosyltrehalose trehalohydrolase